MSTSFVLAEDKPEADICLMCGLEGWGCICDPTRPRRRATEADLEQARRTRLTRAELAAEAGERDV